MIEETAALIEETAALIEETAALIEETTALIEETSALNVFNRVNENYGLSLPIPVSYMYITRFARFLSLSSLVREDKRCI